MVILNMTNCGICKNGIDIGACGQTLGIYTQDIDENEKHRKERIYLCQSCNLKVRIFITGLKIDEIKV